MEKSYVWLVPGERLVIGGAWTDGPEMSGMWQLNRIQKRANTQASHCKFSIASIAIWATRHGLLKGFMTKEGNAF